MRKLIVALAAGTLLATASVAPTAHAAADVRESITIKTARAVSYGDAFRHSESDPWASYAFRPRMAVVTAVRCDTGKQAVVYFSPVTAHQAPQAGPVTCTGRSQNVTIFAAAGQVGPVKVRTELRYYKNYQAGAAVARHSRTVMATDVQAFAGTVKAPARVEKGQPLQLTASVQHLTQGTWKPLRATLQVRVQEDGGESRIVGTTTSSKNGRVTYTTPPVTRNGSWHLVWNRGGRDWWTGGARVQVTTPAPAAPAIWIGRTTSTTADVHWTAPPGVKVTGYRFGWTSSNGKPVPAWQGDWPANRTSPLTMINLHPGTTYTMWVAALTAQGEGRRASVKVTTLPAQPAAAPKFWSGKVTRTTADVHWTAPPGVKVTGYRFGWTSSNGKPVPAWQGDWPANRTSPLTMTNLHPGTTYTMWVAALTAQGEGRRASVKVTTLP